MVYWKIVYIQCLKEKLSLIYKENSYIFNQLKYSILFDVKWDFLERYGNYAVLPYFGGGNSAQKNNFLTTYFKEE